MASETWICIGLQNWDNGISLVTAEIVSINPNHAFLGVLKLWDNTLSMKYPAPLFQQFLTHNGQVQEKNASAEKILTIA